MPTVYNKVVADNTTLIDLSQDTVTQASHIVSGYVGHLADGTQVTGTGGITPTGTKSITISASGTTTEDVTNYASAAITVGAGTEGTPTATKGTVSSHSVTVTPSVTNAAGYITGGTKTGTAVTVSASELVSGSETKTSNGTYDVTNLAELVVNVSGGGGASNVVTGTFKGTTTGSILEVTLNYTGSGYPVAFAIFPDVGAYKSGSAIYTLVQQYAVVDYLAIKSDTSTTPAFDTSGTDGNGTILYRYKGSSSNSTSYSNRGSDNFGIMADQPAQTGNTSFARLRSKTKLSVYITGGGGYGFPANIDYRYIVLYSS